MLLLLLLLVQVPVVRVVRVLLVQALLLALVPVETEASLRCRRSYRRAPRRWGLGVGSAACRSCAPRRQRGGRPAVRPAPLRARAWGGALGARTRGCAV